MENRSNAGKLQLESIFCLLLKIELGMVLLSSIAFVCVPARLVSGSSNLAEALPSGETLPSS